MRISDWSSDVCSSDLLIIIVSFVLMLLIVILGPTRFLLSALVENIGLYLHAFVTRTFHVYAYEPTEWVGSWTVFYWGWWISWAPFVGIDRKSTRLNSSH